MRSWILLGLAMAACGTALRGEEAPVAETWRVMLEPKFMRAGVTQAVAGAQKTELAAAIVEGEEVRTLKKEELEKLGVDWAGFAAKAAENAAADLKTLEPKFERDRKKVIEFAELRSERPIVASAVLSLKLVEKFRATLGEQLLVVVPNRFQAFVFPKLASNYQLYAPMVFEAYRATAHPVSLEVFEVTAEGMRAVGVYEEP